MILRELWDRGLFTYTIDRKIMVTARCTQAVMYNNRIVNFLFPLDFLLVLCIIELSGTLVPDRR